MDGLLTVFISEEVKIQAVMNQIRNDAAELDEEAVAEARFDCFLPVEETWKEFWKKEKGRVAR